MLTLNKNMDEITVVFAHPDDELLYFYQTLQQLKPQYLRLVCVTGRFDRDEARRLRELANTAKAMGGELMNLGLEDRRRQPLDAQNLNEQLKKIAVKAGTPVLTHGPFGEYGHRHHVDVFRAVVQHFGDCTWCLSGPLIENFECTLDHDTYEQKRALVCSLYPSQNIEAYATRQERLTLVSRSIYADVLLAGCKRGVDGVSRQRVIAFLEQAQAAYFGRHEDIPLEAQSAASASGIFTVHQHMEARIREWQDFFVA